MTDLKHVHPHKKESYLMNNCHCVFCRPLEHTCNCEGCKGIREKEFKITHLDFEDSKPIFCRGNMPPNFLATRAPGSTMDSSWFWDGYVLKLEIGEHVDTDFRRITRIK